MESVSFKYNHVPVLDDVSLTVESGQFIGIIGPNGAGKTTILKLIEKLLKPKEGVISLGNEDLNHMKQTDISKIVGYIPQSEGSPFPATVFNTILLGRKPHFSWGPTKRDLQIVSEIIAELNLTDLSLRNIHEMSGGQRQKVIFGRALAQEPEILLLDEPTANLDLKHQLEILELLRDLSCKGTTIIMAIHDMNLALKYCDKFIMIYDHKVFAHGGSEIFTEENIEKVFGVRVSIMKNRGRLFLIPESYVKQGERSNKCEKIMKKEHEEK